MPDDQLSGNDESLPRYPRRTERARRTRAAILTAAGDLFSEQGYLATTIEQIAQRADVARPTVFTAVPGGKPQLLKEARDLALAGDDEPVPIPQRSWFLQAMSQTDPRALLRRQASNWRMMHEREARLELALEAAAASDPVLRDLYAEALRQRWNGCRLVVGYVDRLSALTTGLEADRAADTVFALASPQVYAMFVHGRSWTPTEYEQWLTAALEHALLPSSLQ
jgi:AcrR family transcriptional regulator